MTLVLALALSLLIGATLGIMGGGGSILTVPILVYALGLEPKHAIATSLFVVAVTSLAALVPHLREGRVRLRTGLVFGAAGMVGAYGGGLVAHYIPAGVLLLGFAVIMLVTAIAMMRGRRQSAVSDASEKHELPIAKVLAQGLLVGSLSGLVGAGGGFLVVPALVLLGGLPMATAVGTSLLVIALQSAAGFAGYLGHVAIDWKLAGIVTASAVVGSVLGGRFAGRISQQRLRVGFAWFVIAMGLFIVLRQVPEVFGVKPQWSRALPYVLLLLLTPGAYFLGRTRGAKRGGPANRSLLGNTPHSVPPPSFGTEG